MAKKKIVLLCKHCNMDVDVRNPSGYCDHLYYPENCKVCKPVPQRKTTVVFNRYKNFNPEEQPDTHVWTGHPDDALFDFVYQQLGYSVLLITHDEGDHIEVREM